MSPFDKDIYKEESKLFFKRWIQHPSQLGTLAPISKTLARNSAQLISSPEDKIVVEIGAGTGRLSREILKTGVKPSHFYAVELDKDLCQFLKQTIPNAHIIHGDACYLTDMLPREIIGKVDILYSVIPLMYLPQPTRNQIYTSGRSILKETGRFYHVCYSPVSPFKNENTIQSQRVFSKWMNIPPGFVWSFDNVEI